MKNQNVLAFTSKYQKDAYKALMSTPTAVQSLKLFSVSDSDFALRTAAYVNAMAQTAQLEDMALRQGAQRRVAKFATNAAPGMGAADLRGLTIYPATILSYVSSIAPIFGVERNVDTPNAALMFVDFYSLLDGDLVLPNLGKDKSFGKNIYRKDMTTLIDGSTTEFSVTVGSALIPRSLNVTYVSANNQIETVVDNGNGTLLAAPGLLATGSEINYKGGTITIVFATAPAAGAKLTLEVAEDIPSNDQVDKLAGETKYFNISTEPIMIPIIRNIITDAALNKQGVIDPNTLYTNLIQTQYTKLINEKVVNCIVDNYDGDTYTADLSSFNLAAGFYDTFIRTFQSILVNGQTILGQQTYKGCTVTGILAGRDIANVFQYMSSGEGWTPNDQLMYFKDLIGWYKGVPVVRWEDDTKIAPDECYLTHKTPDGQLAPIARAMFITPTDLPEISSFDNPSQLSNGCFSIEGVDFTTSKLVVKLKFLLPTSQFLQKA